MIHEAVKSRISCIKISIKMSSLLLPNNRYIYPVRKRDAFPATFHVNFNNYSPMKRRREEEREKKKEETINGSGRNTMPDMRETRTHKHNGRRA